MVLDWTAEEKTLLNMEKIIAAAWRMNRQQLHSYYRRIQKKQPEILPGQTGIVFLKTLKRIADGDTDAAKVWPDLMQDTERILKLIRANRNLDQKVWLAALPRLEAQQDYCFKTETGMAFITALKEKPGICLPEKRQGHHAEASSVNTVRTAIRDDERELEKVAVWLMGDPSGQKEKVKKKKAVFFSGCIRQAAIPALACLSVCCLAIWLYGQAGRNMDRWNLHLETGSARSDSGLTGRKELLICKKKKSRKVNCSLFSFLLFLFPLG